MISQTCLAHYKHIHFTYKSRWSTYLQENIHIIAKIIQNCSIYGFKADKNERKGGVRP